MRLLPVQWTISFVYTKKLEIVVNPWTQFSSFHAADATTLLLLLSLFFPGTNSIMLIWPTETNRSRLYCFIPSFPSVWSICRLIYRFPCCCHITKYMPRARIYLCLVGYYASAATASFLLQGLAHRHRHRGREKISPPSFSAAFFSLRRMIYCVNCAMEGYISILLLGLV